MYRVKLTKGLSYHGIVTATNLKPIVEVEDEETALAAVSSGYFEIIEHVGDNSENEDRKPLDKMTEKELDTYAEERGIDLKGLTKKADKLAKINETLNQNGGKEPDFNV